MARKRNRGSDQRAPSRSRGILRSARSVVEETEPVLEIESTVTFLVLAVLFVPIGLVTLVVSALLGLGLSTLIGTPTGVLGTVVRLVWLGLTIGALFLIYRALFRRLPRRVREHAVPGLPRRDEAEDEPTAAHGRDRGQAGAVASSPSLAELDARLAPEDQQAQAPPSSRAGGS